MTAEYQNQAVGLRGVCMGRNKTGGKKLRLSAKAKLKPAPRWSDIKKFGLKRARTRRIRVRTKDWRRGSKLKV